VTNAVSLRRRRDLSQIFNDSFKVYSGAPYMPLLFILALPTVALNLSLHIVQHNVPSWVDLLVGTPLSIVLSAMLGTGAIYALDQMDRGNILRAGDAIAEALRRANHLIWSTLKVLAICGLFAITIVGIPWAIAHLISWWFTSHAIMIDGKDGNEALRYSHDLVAGRGWPTFGLMFAIGLPIAITDGILRGAVYLISGGFTAGLAGSVLPLLTFPFGTMATLLVYYDLKMRKALA